MNSLSYLNDFKSSDYEKEVLILKLLFNYANDRLLTHPAELG